MTIKKTAFDTLACDGFGPILKKIVNSIEVALVYGSLKPEEDTGNSNESSNNNKTVKYENVLFVKGTSSEENEIPMFSHPVLISKDNKQYIVSDLRNYGKYDSTQNKFIVKQETDYKLAVHRADINDIWINSDPNILRDISHIPLAIYSTWIAESVAKRFALDPREQFMLTILSGIYYYSLFNQADKELNETDKLRLVNVLIKSLHASSKDILSVTDICSNITDIKHFCDLAEKVTGSIRLRDLNPGTLYATIGGTWYSSNLNSREILAVAIEHPPTWITLLLYCISERSYKNSQLAKITERNMYRNASEDFVKSVLNLIRMMAS